MSSTSSDLLRHISEEFCLSHVQQDWGVENASNVSINKAFAVFDAYFGKDAYVDQQITDLLFEAANNALIEDAMSQEEQKLFRRLVSSAKFRTIPLARM
jgi:hypothetical protein